MDSQHAWTHNTHAWTDNTHACTHTNATPQVLYLHGNQISSLADVCKLSQLKNLSKLTLHGNPISEHTNYKMYIAAHLPNLRSLDFSTITKIDRDKVR